MTETFYDVMRRQGITRFAVHVRPARIAREPIHHTPVATVNDPVMRRLREQIKQERMKNQGFQQHVRKRLDRHDEELGVDTRQLGAGEPFTVTDAQGDWWGGLGGGTVAQV